MRVAYSDCMCRRCRRSTTKKLRSCIHASLRKRVFFPRGTALCYVQVMEATEQAYRAFQRQVDRVCTLILFERPECEIERARIELRSEAKRFFPDNAQLYEIIYESRFRRLWDQFCKQGGD
jgi:hypothetical protein